jgi:transglutaminase-like putative cysteine protease
MTLYAVRHATRFSYEKPVSFARCNLRLKPIDWPGQRLSSHHLAVHPGGQLSPAPQRSTLVNITRLVIPQAAGHIEIVSEAEVEVWHQPALPAPEDPTVAAVAEMARTSLDVSDVAPANFLYPSPSIPADDSIAAWALDSLTAQRPVLEAASEFSRRIHEEFRFDPDATRTETPPAEAFAARAGVCQDFSQIMICGLRAAGLPAAYVSGYIRTIPPPGQARLQGADATHGWVMVWCGTDRGWIGLDPTNGIAMGDDHIVMAVGRDYLDIAPIDGVFTGHGEQEITVEVDVEPLPSVSP